MSAATRFIDHPLRRPRAGWSMVHVGAAALCVAALLAGCSTGVDGDPVAATGTGASGEATSELDRVSLTAADFPTAYPATRLRTEQAGAALADLSGNAPGTTVTPSSCEPPQISAASGESVVLVGMSADGGSLTVVTTTSQTPLSELTGQIGRCGTYSVDNGGVTSRVSAEVLPPSPIESEESIAFRRVTRSGEAPVTLTQSTTVLAAQNNGIRVYASYLSFSGARPDGAALDAIFTKAVQKSRSG